MRGIVARRFLEPISFEPTGGDSDASSSTPVVVGVGDDCITAAAADGGDGGKSGAISVIRHRHPSI